MKSVLSQLMGPLAIALALFLVYVCRGTFAMLFVSLLLAYLVRPLVDLLVRRMPRGVAAGLVLMTLLVAAVGLVVWFVPQLLALTAHAMRELPAVISRGYVRLRDLGARNLPAAWVDNLNAALERLSAQLWAFLAGRFTAVVGVIPRILAVAIVPVLSFYMVKDGQEIVDWLVAWVPERRRKRVHHMVDTADRTLTAFVKGQGVVSLIQAAQCTIVLSLIGLPYAPVVGLLAGIAECVPMVGATVVLLLIILIGLSEGGWMWAYAAGSYFTLNQILGYLVTPRIMRQHLEVHPLAVLVAVAAGAELAGIMGVLFALPFTAMVKALLMAWKAEKTAAAG